MSYANLILIVILGFAVGMGAMFIIALYKFTLKYLSH